MKGFFLENYKFSSLADKQTSGNAGKYNLKFSNMREKNKSFLIFTPDLACTL